MGKLAKILTYPLRAPLHVYERTVSRAIHSPGRAAVWGDIGSIPRRLRALHNSPTGDPGALRDDFRLVLNAWGITRAELPKVIRGLRLEISAWVALGAGALLSGAYLVAIGGRWASIGGDLAVISLAVAMVTARAWRLWVLQNQRFVPFGYWFKGGAQ